MKIVQPLLIACFIATSLVESSFDVEGKVALITGGCGGIGSAYARSLLSSGLKGVALVDKNYTNAPRLLKEFKRNFGADSVIIIKADVTDSAALEAAMEKTGKHFKQLDIVINNAGILGEDTPKLLALTNFVAVVEGTKLAFDKILPKYKNGTEGLVVNTASIAGLVASAWVPIYSGTKAGIIAIGQTMGHPHYYEPNNIKILTLCPGMTDTPLVHDLILNRSDFIEEVTYGSFHRVQEADVVGEALMTMLADGNSGDVYSIDNGNVVKIDFTVTTQSLASQVIPAALPTGK